MREKIAKNVEGRLCSLVALRSRPSSSREIGFANSALELYLDDLVSKVVRMIFLCLDR